MTRPKRAATKAKVRKPAAKPRRRRTPPNKKKQMAVSSAAGPGKWVAPGSILREFDADRLGRLAKGKEWSEVDRRVFLPFQANTREGWNKVVASVASAIAKGPLFGSGVVLAGEVPESLAHLIQWPITCEAPAMVVFAGEPIFVGSMTGRFADAIGAGQLGGRVDTLPDLGVLAAVADREVFLHDSSDLAPAADRIAAAGLQVNLCRPESFEFELMPAIYAWMGGVSKLPNTPMGPKHAKAFRAAWKAWKARKELE